MRRLVRLLALLVLAAGACSPQQPSSTATSSRTQPVVSLDAAVATPAGFPVDFPLYPRARLTAAAVFASGGQMTWGMEWESVDAQARVAAFYTRQLGQGAWVLTGTTSPHGDFAATFARSSDKNAHGTVYASGSAMVTRILVSLVLPSS